jgi:DegV family protein with EDD domain
MGSIAILTDSTAQFPFHSFAGRELVRTIPFDVEIRAKLYEGGRNLKPGDLPSFAAGSVQPRLIPPTPEQFGKYFAADEKGQPYDQVLAIFTSSHLCEIVDQATKGQQMANGRGNIQIIDSQTTSVGLGALVQIASEAVMAGKKISEVERLVRSLIPHIYTVFCTPGLTYLYHSGFLDQAQANVGELLGLLPLFSIEEGVLSPLEKVRNHRQALDFFQEFMEEFDHLQHIAFVQNGTGGNPQDGRILREHALACFPHTPFSEHTINGPISTLFGPNALGLFVIESNEYKKRSN